MSLLITSNTPSNEIGSVDSGGINRPFSYMNNLQDTLRIPTNSEIAVQSVKINRSGVKSVSSSDRFGVYFGTPIPADETNEDYNDITVPTSILAEKDGTSFVGSAESIAEKIEIAGNKVLNHPNLCKNVAPAVNPGFTCVVKRNVNNTDFEGFNFGMTNTDNTKNISKFSASWIADDGLGSEFDYNTGTRVLKNDTGDTEFCIGIDYPLSQASGVFSASITTFDTYKMIGLTRAQSEATDYSNPYKFVPSYFSDAKTDFYDWVVEIESDNEIQVFHAIQSTADSYEMVEYDYRWMNSGAYFDTKVDGIDKVSFVLKNERVSILLHKGATTHTLTDGTNTVSASNVKSINMNTRFLYPKITLEDNDVVGIAEYNGVDVLDHVYGNDLLSERQPPTELTPFINWWPQNFNTTQANEIDTEWTHFDNTGNFLSQVGLNSSGQIDKKPSIMCGLSDQYLETEDLNTELLFGFNNRPVVKTPTAIGGASPFTLSFISDEAPSLKATSSLFIRVRNMTFDSVNFSKSATSKILYHLPAFSNDGTSTGGLYFEPSERVYLKLNNIVDQFITTIEVDIVNADETLADDVTGKTTVIFHIKDA